MKHFQCLSLIQNQFQSLFNTCNWGNHNIEFCLEPTLPLSIMHIQQCDLSQNKFECLIQESLYESVHHMTSVKRFGKGRKHSQRKIYVMLLLNICGEKFCKYVENKIHCELQPINYSPTQYCCLNVMKISCLCI